MKCPDPGLLSAKCLKAPAAGKMKPGSG